ncbi:MAG: rhamnulokinase [Phycisphaerales bacterium]|nr:rhamnulokinase [Phycisphaerales bacterium]
MNKPAHFAAVDLGASSGRVLLGTIADDKLTLAEANRFYNGAVRIIDELHWPILYLWHEMKQGVLQAARQVEGNLSGIGLDTWGVDFALLGKGDILLGAPFNYRDPRTNGIYERAFPIVSREEIFENSGIQFMQLNSIFQLVAMKLDGSPLLDWAETFLMIPDLFNFWFTGQKVVEFSNATTTQLYDPRAGGWSTKLIEKFNLPGKIFPKIVPSGTVLGPLLDHVAEELKVGPDVPLIAPATHDTGSAVAAVPASKDKPWAYISSGTWSLMGVEVDHPIINADSLKYNFTNEGGVNGTFRFLKNIMGLWLVQECRRVWQQAGQEYSFGQLAEMAGNAKPFAAVIDPDNAGFFQPGDMPARIREYCTNSKQTPPQDPGQVIRVCLEGLAMTYRLTLEQVEACTKERVEVIHVVGGGTQNKLLCQMTADATGRKVVAGPVEATAIGNIAVQAVATRLLPDIWAARELVRRSFDVVNYEPQNTAAWNAPYKRFVELRG